MPLKTSFKIFAPNSKIIYQTSPWSQAGAVTGLIYQKPFTVNHTLKRSLPAECCKNRQK